MRKTLVVFAVAVLLVFNLMRCETDKSILSPAGELEFNSSATPNSIASFDAYSNESVVKLYWTAGASILDPGPMPPKVGIVRLYVSDDGPEDGFVQIFETHNVGVDSTTIGSLASNTNYYFRLGVFTPGDTLIGVSAPLMISLGKNKVEHYSIPVPDNDSPGDFSKMSWSPDGDKLAIVMVNGALVQNIYLLDVHSQTQQPLTSFNDSEGRMGSLAFSPNGNQIAFTYSPSRTIYKINYQIWTMAVDATDPAPASSGRVDDNPGWFSEEKVVFCKGTFDPPNIPELYSLDLNTGIETALTQDQTIYKYTPSVSLENSQIVYSGRMSNKKELLYLISLTGENNTPLTTGKYWRDIQPAWSGDGQWIYFSSDRSGHYEIWAIDAGSGACRQITFGLERGVDRLEPKPNPVNGLVAIKEQLPPDPPRLIMLPM